MIASRKNKSLISLYPSQQITHQIPQKGQIFGLPLIELTARCDNDAGIPNIVVQCANYIRQHGMQGR